MKLNNVYCNLCGSDKAQVIYPAKGSEKEFNCNSVACTNDGNGEYFQLVKCCCCGLYYSSPRPTGNDLKQLYTKVKDRIYQEELNGRIKTFRSSLARLKQFKQFGKLLDIGSSIGVFVKEANSDGYDAYGIEPSVWCVKSGQNLFGFTKEKELRVGDYNDLPIAEEKFDIITMWDVLEHLDDPKKALSNINKSLSENGILGFSTVDIGSFYARLLGKSWPWLMKMHIYYFTRQTIKKYLEETGFEVLKITTYKHTVSTNYLLYKLKSLNKLLYVSILLFKKIFLLNRNTYITIAMGDFMEVYAKKKD